MIFERLEENWITVFKYVYFFIVFFDFILAPILHMHLQHLNIGQLVTSDYRGATIGCGYIFHLVSMGIIWEMGD